MRRDAKVDANQKAIVAALRAVGCKVKCTHRLGDGYVDVNVWSPFTLRVYLGEIKTPGGQLTPAEIDFHDEWEEAAEHGDLCIWETIDEALDAVGALPSRRIKCKR